MGGSDGNEGGSSGAVDSSVGTIVWVRRRNGSWWPGRILGSDELSASHLMSPRSGTPVKLLGRDDASVDWYNLEKSKRVKAFRCGEFDACIARAEASQGMPIKKREKYARREDAIIHALELEQQQLEMRTSKPRISNAHKQESSIFALDVYNSDTDPRAGARMRGLQNFGLRIAPPKKKHSQFVPWEEASGNSIPNIGVDIPDASHYGSGKSKRKMIGGSYDDSHAKKRRPIVQVLKNSVKLPASLPLQFEHSERDNVSNSYDSLGNNGDPTEEVPGDSSNYSGHLQDEYSSSEMAEETESDSMGTEYLEHDTEDDGSLTDTTQSIVPAHRHRRAAEKFSNPNHKIPDTGVSNWHVKGKRNTRNTSKKSSDFIYENAAFSDSFKRNSINLRRMLSSSRKQGISQRKYPFDANSPSSEDEEDDDLYYYNDVVDVNVEVEKQSYKYNTEHVPWVSLSSKGNHGRPIVGHPIQVEVLEEGSTDGLVLKYEIYEEPPALHKFAKRTSSYRIPRSSVDDDGDPLYSDHEEKQRVKKSNASSKWRTSKKKTRTLSSLGSEKKHSRRSSSVLDGLIKAEDRIPIVTCIPVKVVFSRILETVGRSSSVSAHRRGML